MTEEQRALMEAHLIEFEEQYFGARPALYRTPTELSIFAAAFKEAWTLRDSQDVELKCKPEGKRVYTYPLTLQHSGEEIMLSTSMCKYPNATLVMDNG